MWHILETLRMTFSTNAQKEFCFLSSAFIQEGICGKWSKTLFYIFVRSGLEEKHTTKIYHFIRLPFSVKITGPVNSIKKKKITKYKKSTKFAPDETILKRSFISTVRSAIHVHLSVSLSSEALQIGEIWNRRGFSFCGVDTKHFFKRSMGFVWPSLFQTQFQNVCWFIVRSVDET